MTTNNVRIRDNDISSNTGSAIMYYYSSALIEDNELYYNGTGIYANNSPLRIRRNAIYLNNNNGIILISSSFDLASLNALVRSGQRDLYVVNPGVVSFSANDFRTNNNSISIEATNNAWVYGSNNFFGSGSPDPDHFYTSNGGFISYTPPSDSPFACSVWPCNQNKIIEEPAVILQTKQSKKTNTKDDLAEVLTLLTEREYGLAFDQLEAKFHQSRQSSERRNILLLMADVYQKNNEMEAFIKYLHEKVKPHVKRNSLEYATILSIESQFLVRSGEYRKAYTNYARLQGQFKADSLIHQQALYGLGYVNYELIGAESRGSRYFGELIERYPNSELAMQVSQYYGEDLSPGIEQARIMLDEENKVSDVMLHVNYPNPYNPVTTIRYDLPEATDVRLVVYDLLGRRVAILVDGQINAGNHSVQFDASNLASGVYIYRMSTPEFSKTRQMTVVK